MGTDKDLEKLVDDLMKEAPLDSPSIHFTHNVIEEIENLTIAKRGYTTLISKKALFACIIGLVVLAFYVFTTGNGTVGDSFGYTRYLAQGSSWISNTLPQVQFSKTFSYTVGAIGLMVCFQTYVLKRYFRNRWV